MKSMLIPGANELREIPGHPTGSAHSRVTRLLSDPARYMARRNGGESERI